LQQISLGLFLGYPSGFWTVPYKLNSFKSADGEELWVDKGDAIIVPSSTAMVMSLGQCVRFPHRLPRMMVKDEAKIGQIEGLVGLSAVEFVGYHKVF